MLLAERARAVARRQSTNLILFAVGIDVALSGAKLGNAAGSASCLQLPESIGEYFHASPSPDRMQPVTFDRSLRKRVTIGNAAAMNIGFK
jgi:hypothetical protein